MCITVAFYHYFVFLYSSLGGLSSDHEFIVLVAVQTVLAPKTLPYELKRIQWTCNRKEHGKWRVTRMSIFDHTAMQKQRWFSLSVTYTKMKDSNDSYKLCGQPAIIRY